MIKTNEINRTRKRRPVTEEHGAKSLSEEPGVTITSSLTRFLADNRSKASAWHAESQSEFQYCTETIDFIVAVVLFMN